MPKPSSIRSAVSIEHRLVTDGHRPMASTAAAQHRAVKTQEAFSQAQQRAAHARTAHYACIHCFSCCSAWMKMSLPEHTGWRSGSTRCTWQWTATYRPSYTCIAYFACVTCRCFCCRLIWTLKNCDHCTSGPKCHECSLSCRPFTVQVSGQLERLQRNVCPFTGVIRWPIGKTVNKKGFQNQRTQKLYQPGMLLEPSKNNISKPRNVLSNAITDS